MDWADEIAVRITDELMRSRPVGQQIADAIRKARADALEEAAIICENGAEAYAAAIRALKEK